MSQSINQKLEKCQVGDFIRAHVTTKRFYENELHEITESFEGILESVSDGTLTIRIEEGQRQVQILQKQLTLIEIQSRAEQSKDVQQVQSESSENNGLTDKAENPHSSNREAGSYQQSPAETVDRQSNDQRTSEILQASSQRSEKPMTVAKVKSEPVAKQHAEENETDDQQGVDWEKEKERLAQFSGKCKIDFQSPDFESVPKDFRKGVVTSWKNKYEHQLRIDGSKSFSSHVANLEKEAAQLDRTEGYVYAAQLSQNVGELKTAKRLYLKSIRKKNSYNATFGYASICAQEEKWNEVVEVLSVALSDRMLSNAEERDCLIYIGEAITCMGKANLDGIAGLLEFVVGEQSKQLTKELIAYCLFEDYQDAAKAILVDNNIEKAKLFARDSKVFNKWKEPEKFQKQAPASDKKRQVVEAKDDEFFVGHIKGFDGKNETGQIVDKNGDLFVFKLRRVMPRLREELISGLSGGTEVEFMIEKGRGTNRREAVRVSRRTNRTRSKTGADKNANGKKTAVKVDAPGQQLTSSDLRLNYDRARRFKELGKFADAEHLLIPIYQSNHSLAHQAVKQLCEIWNSQGKRKQAVIELKKTIEKVDAKNQRSLKNLLVEFLVQDRDFAQAINVLDSMINHSDDADKQKIVLRIGAYYDRAGQKEQAVEYLESANSKWKSERIAQAIDGIRNRIEDVESRRDSSIDGIDSELEDLTYGVVEYEIQSCNFEAASDEIRAYYQENKRFRAKHFDVVRKYAEQATAKKNNTRADLHFTIAAMASVSPEVAEGNTDINRVNSSRLGCIFRGMHMLFEHGHQNRDVARSYFADALRHCVDSKGVAAILPSLLLSYLTELPSFNEIVEAKGFVSLEKVKPLLYRDDAGFKRFEEDLPYYLASSDYLESPVIKILAGDPKRRFDAENLDLETKTEKEQDRLINERNHLKQLARQAFNSAWVESAKETLAEYRKSTRFLLDNLRIRKLEEVISRLGNYFKHTESYRQKQTEYLSAQAVLQELDSETKKTPTILSVSVFQKLVEYITRELEKNWTRHTIKSVPQLLLTKGYDGKDDYHPIKNGELNVPFDLTSEPGSAPAENISIGVFDPDGKCYLQQTIYENSFEGNKPYSFTITLKPDAKDIEAGAFDVEVVLKFNTEDDQSHESKFPFAIRIGHSAEFTNIEADYYRYRAGGEVTDKNMFFGREEILSRIIKIIEAPGDGDCFVFHGQMRSGKSSVLKMVLNQLRDKKEYLVVEADLSGGEHADAKKFLVMLSNELCDASLERGITIPEESINESKFDFDPVLQFKNVIRAIQNQFKAAGESIRIVLLLDEWTYVYDDHNKGVDVSLFMRQWKSMLQKQLFTAVIAGQDSMVDFVKDHENVFRRTDLVRLSYFTREEAERFAVDPIRDENGNSRYRPNAFDVLYDYTYGAPFYMMKFCAALVDYLNDKKTNAICAADIHAVAKLLLKTDYEHRLELGDFHPFYERARVDFGNLTKDEILKFLIFVAKYSTLERSASIDILEDYPKKDQLIKDLSDREVISVDRTGIKILVGLFGEYVRKYE